MAEKGRISEDFCFSSREAFFYKNCLGGVGKKEKERKNEEEEMMEMLEIALPLSDLLEAFQEVRS